MNIAYICSNYLPLQDTTTKGTEIFNFAFLNEASKYLERKGDFQKDSMTVFAAQDSKIPFSVESIGDATLTRFNNIDRWNKHTIYELSLLSKAFSKSPPYDVYHINIGDGDISLPFTRFTNKPVIITLHHLIDEDFTRDHFKLYQNNPNIHFVSISNAQRRIVPNLNYLATIYHGVDTNKFAWNADSNNHLMWAGRAIPEKGADLVVATSQTIGCDARLFAVPKTEHAQWFKDHVINQIGLQNQSPTITISTNQHRLQLISEYQQSKAFLFPISYEESFGLVLIEAMSCGTPVIAFARGSIPEIIEDGKTGYIVNASKNDIRGNWITQKTGLEGLIDATKRLYSLSKDDYIEMRQACRNRVTQYFSIERMVEDYFAAYRSVVRSD